MHYDFFYKVDEFTVEEENISENLVTQIRFIHNIRIKNELDMVLIMRPKYYVAHLKEPIEKSLLENNKNLVVEAIETAFGQEQIIHMQNLLKQEIQEEQSITLE